VKRVIAGVIGLAAGATLLMACHTNSTPHSSASVSTASAANSTEVKVDGNNVPGLDLSTVSCVRQGGNIDIGSGSINGQQGLGVVMTDGNPPTVQSLGIVVDGNALAVSNNMGVAVGSAKVSVSGNTYTITGQASGADLKNPMNGQITKNFEIKVTCS
jgi:ipoprotein LpqH